MVVFLPVFVLDLVAFLADVMITALLVSISLFFSLFEFCCPFFLNKALWNKTKEYMFVVMLLGCEKFDILSRKIIEDQIAFRPTFDLCDFH